MVTNEVGRINATSQIEVLVSRQTIVSDFKRLLAEKLEVKESLDKIRLRSNYEDKSMLIKHEDKTLEDSKVMDRHTIIMEIKLKDGSWPQNRKKPLDKRGFKQQAGSGKDAIVGAFRSVEYFIFGKPQPKRSAGMYYGTKDLVFLHPTLSSVSLLLY